MGNSANITVSYLAGATSADPVIYLHWNGGPDSIHAFVSRLEEVGWTCSASALVNLVCIAKAFIGGRNTVYIFERDSVKELHDADNGHYHIQLPKGKSRKCVIQHSRNGEAATALNRESLDAEESAEETAAWKEKLRAFTPFLEESHNL